MKSVNGSNQGILNLEKLYLLWADVFCYKIVTNLRKNFIESTLEYKISPQ